MASEAAARECQLPTSLIAAMPPKMSAETATGARSIHNVAKSPLTKSHMTMPPVPALSHRDFTSSGGRRAMTAVTMPIQLFGEGGHDVELGTPPPTGLRVRLVS